MALLVLNYKEVVKALEKVGFKIAGNKGSHLKMKKPKMSASDSVRIVIIPRHPRNSSWHAKAYNRTSRVKSGGLFEVTLRFDV